MKGLLSIRGLHSSLCLQSTDDRGSAPSQRTPMGYPTNPMIRDVITIMIMPNRYIWLRLLYSCPWSMAMVAKEEGNDRRMSRTSLSPGQCPPR